MQEACGGSRDGNEVILMDELDFIIKQVDELGIGDEFKLKTYKTMMNRGHKVLLLRNWLRAVQVRYLDKASVIEGLLADLDRLLETLPK